MDSNYDDQPLYFGAFLISQNFSAERVTPTLFVCESVNRANSSKELCERSFSYLNERNHFEPNYEGPLASKNVY
jgi:hypothetical protein